MKKLFYVFLTFVFTTHGLKAQLLNDPEYLAISKNAMNKIYNFQFQEAGQYISQLKGKYENHPVYPFLQAMMLFWQNQPLTKSSPRFEDYHQLLLKTSVNADAILSKDENNIEANFFQLACYGLLSLHESEDGDMFQAMNYGRKAYQHVKKGFDLVEVFPEFYFSSGLYNYYVVKYPEVHPGVKGLMNFFVDGDKQKGLFQLNMAVQKANFTNIEASIYLADIYMKYENNYLLAVYQTQSLLNQFPNNPFFWLKHCEALLGNARYAEATTCLSHFSYRTELLYSTAFRLFRAIIFEKYHQNYGDAYSEYNKIIALERVDKRYTQDYQAQAYAGLARLADWAGNTDTAKEMYRKALKYAEYEGIRAEANQYLKSK